MFVRLRAKICIVAKRSRGQLFTTVLSAILYKAKLKSYLPESWLSKYSFTKLSTVFLRLSSFENITKRARKMKLLSCLLGDQALNVPCDE